MSLSEQEKKGHKYLKFQAGRGRTLHLGRSDLSRINVKNVLDSLDYVKKKYGHYSDVESRLISLLPEPAREEYVVRRMKDLNEQAVNLLRYLPE